MCKHLVVLSTGYYLLKGAGVAGKGDSVCSTAFRFSVIAVFLQAVESLRRVLVRLVKSG